MLLSCDKGPVRDKSNAGDKGPVRERGHVRDKDPVRDKVTIRDKGPVRDKVRDLLDIKAGTANLFIPMSNHLFSECI